MQLKDAMIFMDFFKRGFKEDIQSSIHYLLSTDTYKSIFSSSKTTIRKTFFGAKNQLYMSMFAVVLGFMIKGILVKIMVVILFIVMYIRYKWKTGDPMRFYKENYFSGQINRKV